MTQPANNVEQKKKVTFKSYDFLVTLFLPLSPSGALSIKTSIPLRTRQERKNIQCSDMVCVLDLQP